MMEKFPNFAHTYIATIGTMISYSQVRLSGFTPYQAIPVAILGCGLLGLALYVIVVHPIKATGAREITLTFAFFALTEVSASFVAIYSYWLLMARGIESSGFFFFTQGFEWEGYPGVLLVAIPVCLVLVSFLYFFLTRMKQGVAFRAVAEDKTLASILGVNVNRMHLMSWFLTGAFAGLAGGLIPLWQYTGLAYNDQFLIFVMTGSVVGGLNTVAGAVIGGFVVVVSQRLLGLAAIALFGINAAVYESLYPVLMVVVVLMIKPEGIMGAFEKPSEGGKPLMTRLKDGLARIVGMIRGSSS
jgi:branched-chain amino acid transport system permease protein